MRPGLILFFPILLLSGSCSSQYGITKASAFVREQHAGTIRVDEKGNPKNSGVSKTYIIYVETKEKQPLPEWQTARVENKIYSIQPAEIKQDLHLGRTPAGEEVVVQVSPSRRLWQLVLFPMPDSTFASEPDQYPVLLTGRWKNKPFRFEIKKVQALETAFGQ